MSDVRCPYCRGEMNVSLHPQWDEGGFDAQCEHCNKWFGVRVEAVEYSYTAHRDENLNRDKGTSD